MSFKLSRLGSTGRADNNPAETDPAAETEPVADTPPAAETGPSDVAVPDATVPDATVPDATVPDATVPDATGGPATAEIPAPRGAGTSDTAAGRPQPSFQPRGAAEPVSTPVFTGPPDDSLEGPLLPDATQLRGNWQQVQASFVDDPRGSVAEAAALVDHAAQALVGALRQRQRALRESWDPADGATDGASPGTEELRIAMQRYRTVFNHICRP